MTIAMRLETVRTQLASACREAGRDPAGVHLVVVSKNAAPSEVVEVVRAGQRCFAENYVQHALAKMQSVSELTAGTAHCRAVLEWHLIGQLQSNKAARAALAFDVIESLASASAARAISRAMTRATVAAPTPTAAAPRRVVPARSVLLQVRLGGPAGRGGVAPQEACAFARTICELPGLRLDGVMAVAPQGEPPRAAFSRLAGVLEELRNARLPNAPLTQMSAGMSGDFPEAIAAGATIVRIGRAVFGH